ncbi:MAG TPA: aminodeoxychorismate/anthranilate synthase component II [Candidatus Merdousia gallistercoris]|nr:aminodeoxychorismate/anthranilate synthase component II [Candidatus Merdousia gallistercoris]
MVLLIDNYDSFTYNLVHYFETLGADMKIVRNDAATAEELFAMSPKAVVISPGPSSPKNAGVCVDFIKKYAGKVPIFGVCLGMQSIGYAFGADIVLARRTMHGKTSMVTHDSTGVFRGMPNPIEVVRYHSLAVAENTLPKCLRVTARAEDGEVMGIRHTDFLVEGVQFHPESIMTFGGKRMLENFLLEAKAL